MKLEKGTKGFFLLPKLNGQEFEVHQEGPHKGQIVKAFVDGEVLEVLKDGAFKVQAKGHKAPWICRPSKGEFLTAEEYQALTAQERAAKKLEELKAEVPTWQPDRLEAEAKKRRLEVPEKATPEQLVALILDDIAVKKG